MRWTNPIMPQLNKRRQWIGKMFSIHQPIHTKAFDEHGRNNGSFISNEKLNPFSNLFDRIVVSIDFISILFWLNPCSFHLVGNSVYQKGRILTLEDLFSQRNLFLFSFHWKYHPFLFILPQCNGNVESVIFHVCVGLWNFAESWGFLKDKSMGKLCLYIHHRVK